MSAQEILNVYTLSRECIYKFCEGLSEDQATWKPAEHSKSMLELLYHLTDAERYWFYKLERAIPEPPHEVTLATTTDHLHEMEQFITNDISNSEPAELTRLIETNRGELSLLWALKRVTHHMHYHLGTLVYLRTQLDPEWESDAGTKLWSTAVDAFSELIPSD